MKTADPRKRHVKPPYRARRQSPPGREKAMEPKADHGEESYQGHGRLAGRVALITGADSGIGRAVAIAFAREGANVLISYLNEHEDARETASWVQHAGRRALCLAGDIGEEKIAKKLVATCFRELGSLDILVNNAAYQGVHESIEEFTAEEVERTYRTNIFGLFHLCRHALPRMKPGVTIVNTASIQAYQPSPTLLAYASTKGAIVNFTKGLSDLAIKQGVRVNAVAPGPVWTPLIPSTFSGRKEIRDFGKATPMGRAGQPAELAPAFVFLASPESSYITGEVIGVTGGSPIS